MRKSLARELVNLQEKLDSHMIGKSQESEMGVHFKTKEELSTVGPNSECMLKQEKHEETEHGDSESTPQDSYVSSADMIEPCQDEFLQMFDSGHSLKGNASVSSCESSVRHFDAEDDRQKLSIASDVSLREPDAEPLEEPKDEAVNGEPDASATMVEERDKADAASEPNQLVQVPLVVDKMEILRPDCTASNATCMETEDLEELPHEIIDDVSVAPELEKETHVEMSKNEVQQPSEHESTTEVISAADIDGATAPGKDVEVLELVEFPVGVFGEDTASSEFEKNGRVELEKNDDLLVEDKCQGAIDATPLEVAVTKGSEHPNEVHENSDVEPEQRVKIGCEEDEEHLSNLVLEGGKEHKEGKGVSDNVHKPEESQLKISPEEKEIQVDIVGAKEEQEGIHDEVGEHLPVLIIEEGTETQEKNIDDTEQDQEAGFATSKEVLAGTIIDPMNVGQVEHEGEPIPASPTCSLVTTAETGSGVETNETLKEENEKLRKMMEKLMEAGKEQLDVISNLTGRVKDLEKKLAKKKKPRTRQLNQRRVHLPTSNYQMFP